MYFHKIALENNLINHLDLLPGVWQLLPLKFGHVHKQDKRGVQICFLTDVQVVQMKSKGNVTGS